MELCRSHLILKLALYRHAWLVKRHRLSIIIIILRFHDQNCPSIRPGCAVQKMVLIFDVHSARPRSSCSLTPVRQKLRFRLIFRPHASFEFSYHSIVDLSFFISFLLFEKEQQHSKCRGRRLTTTCCFNSFTRFDRYDQYVAALFFPTLCDPSSNRSDLSPAARCFPLNLKRLLSPCSRSRRTSNVICEHRPSSYHTLIMQSGQTFRRALPYQSNGNWFSRSNQQTKCEGDFCLRVIFCSLIFKLRRFSS